MGVLAGSRTFEASKLQAARASKISLVARRGLREDETLNYVRFSNRPVEVKRFQAIHDCGVGITRGLVLLFGIGARPFQHGIRGQGGTIFGATLPDDRSKRTCELTSSVVPRGTSFHRVVELEVSSYRI